MKMSNSTIELSAITMSERVENDSHIGRKPKMMAVKTPIVKRTISCSVFLALGVDTVHFALSSK